MSDSIDELKRALRLLMGGAFEPVAPARETSRQVHLEVWRTAEGKTRSAGLQMDLPDRVNLWITTMNVPMILPDTVDRSDKIWTGNRWSDDRNAGANSNLKSYDDFRGKKITCLGVKSLTDAQIILEHLSR